MSDVFEYIEKNSSINPNENMPEIKSENETKNENEKEEFFKQQLKELDKLKVVYYGLNMDLEWDKKENKYKKVVKRYPKYANIKLKTSFNMKLNNVCMIPTGECYNLIGVDIDNKNNTINLFKQLLKDNDLVLNTLKTKTINGGYHYYFHLTDEQKKKLKNINFKAETAKLFNMNIDVKYTNQLFFDVGYIDNKKIYKIIKSKKIDILPDLFFGEILRVNNNGGIIKLRKDNIKTTTLRETTIRDDSRLRKYLNVLPTDYLENYDEWLKIGAIIFNETGNFELFDNYSKKAPNNYNLESVKKMWNDYKEDRENKASINTLIKIVKEIDPNKYFNVFLNDYEGIMDNIFNVGISDSLGGYLFYNLNKDNYIFEKLNRNYYKFNEYGMWKIIDITDLKEDVYKTLSCAIDKEYIRRFKEIDIDKKGELTKTYNSILKYISKNKNRDEMSRTIQSLFGDDEIYMKMDNINPDILPFKNGVYDFKENKFRMGEKDEYITVNTGYEYDEKEDEKTKKELIKILTDIMPDKNERKYLLKIISTGLVGKNPIEEFYIWIGNGANGKGLLRDLIKMTLGEFFDSMEVDYLEKTKHGGHANQADEIMARKKNCRMCITTEPESDIKLRTARLKQLSGNDQVQVRFLHKTLFNFTPKFKLIIQTNNEPEIKGFDGGIKRRLRFIKFNTKFVDNPRRENEKKIDRELKEKIKNIKYGLAFFHILKKYYKMVVDDNYKIELPPRVKNDTAEYLEDNDPITQFINAELIITNDKKDKIKSSILYADFIHSYNTDVSMSEFKNVLNS